MDSIGLRPARSRGRVTRESRNRRMRPTVMALERHELLATFTVNSIADDGSNGTLRWAIGQANSSNEADTIDFDQALFSSAQTIRGMIGVSSEE